MSLSSQTIDTLIDLVEIKLSCFEVWDREDKRELKALQAARDELRTARRPAARRGAAATAAKPANADARGTGAARAKVAVAG
jgi:hypothetical protein